MDIRPDPERLRAFLADPKRPAGTLRYHELQGFFFALASAPDLVPPSEWIPEIFGGGEAEYASVDEMQAVLGALMAIYNEVNSAVFNGVPALPADCTFRRGTLANLDDAAPVSEWARGFTRGHQWLAESWEDGIPKELDDDFGAALMTLSFFATRRLAEGFLAETGTSDLQAFARRMRRLLPEAMTFYAHLGRSIAEALRTVDEPFVAAATPGRNDPCRCGSGRKYKKCCGAV